MGTQARADFEDDTYGDFIRFEAVTLVPFEPKLINFSLLRPEQIDWYNEYNSLIREKVGPRYGDTQCYDMTFITRNLTTLLPTNI